MREDEHWHTAMSVYVCIATVYRPRVLFIHLHIGILRCVHNGHRELQASLCVYLYSGICAKIEINVCVYIYIHTNREVGREVSQSVGW